LSKSQSSPTASLLDNNLQIAASLRELMDEPVPVVLDVSMDELVARAVQSLVSRDAEPTEDAIQLEIQQIRNDQLVAYELYVCSLTHVPLLLILRLLSRKSVASAPEANLDKKFEVLTRRRRRKHHQSWLVSLLASKTSLLSWRKVMFSMHAVTHFVGLKSSYQTFTEYVEAKYVFNDSIVDFLLKARLSDSKQGSHAHADVQPRERANENERQPLLQPDVQDAAQQPALSDSSEDFVDLDDSYKGLSPFIISISIFIL
jgi:hypothetical protein